MGALHSARSGGQHVVAKRIPLAWLEMMQSLSTRLASERHEAELPSPVGGHAGLSCIMIGPMCRDSRGLLAILNW